MQAHTGCAKGNKGSLLPVVAIMIVLASISLIVFSQLSGEKFKLSKIEETQAKMRLIAEALDNYTNHATLGHGDLPCAAPIDLEPGSDGFAIESDACVWGKPTCGRVIWTIIPDVAGLVRQHPVEYAGLPQPSSLSSMLRNASWISPAMAIGLPLATPDGTDPPPYRCTNTPLGGCTGDECIWIGSVPTRTLNIPDEYMYDAWGNRFTYAVTAVLAAGINNFDVAKGKITVKDNAGVVTTKAKYVIISHGPDGKGAYTATGVPGSPCDKTSFDGENCDYTYPQVPVKADRTFVDMGFEFADPDRAEVGDFILWR